MPLQRSTSFFNARQTSDRRCSLGTSLLRSTPIHPIVYSKMVSEKDKKVLMRSGMHVAHQITSDHNSIGSELIGGVMMLLLRRRGRFGR